MPGWDGRGVTEPDRAQEGRALRQPAPAAGAPVTAQRWSLSARGGSVVPGGPRAARTLGAEPRKGSRTPFPGAESYPLSLGTVCPLSWCKSMPLRGQRQFGWRSEPPLPLSGPWCWALLNLGMGRAEVPQLLGEGRRKGQDPETQGGRSHT